MKKLKYLLLFILLFLVFFMNCFAESSLRIAKIIDINGSVNIYKGGGEKKFDAFKGMALTEGDTVITGNNSTATLKIDDDKEVTLTQNSKICISELAGSVKDKNDNTSLILRIGNIFTKIKNKLNPRAKFEIQTPNTVMGVAGTKFYVSMEQDNTYIAVLEGRLFSITKTIEKDSKGNIAHKTIENFLNANEQLSAKELEIAGKELDIQVNPIDLNSIELEVLEKIKEDPEGIEENIINELNVTIDKKADEKIQELISENDVSALRELKNKYPDKISDAQIDNVQKNIDNQKELLEETTGSIQYVPDSGNDNDDDNNNGQEDDKPSIIIDSLTDSINILEGKCFSIQLSTNIEDVNYSLDNSNSQVASVELEGNTLLIEGLSQGTANITVTGSNNDYYSSSITISVSVSSTQKSLIINPDFYYFDDEEYINTYKLLLEGNTFSSNNSVELGGAFSELNNHFFVDDSDNTQTVLTVSGSVYSTSSSATITVLPDNITGNVTVMHGIQYLSCNPYSLNIGEEYTNQLIRITPNLTDFTFRNDISNSNIDLYGSMENMDIVSIQVYPTYIDIYVSGQINPQYQYGFISIDGNMIEGEYNYDNITAKLDTIIPVVYTDVFPEVCDYDWTEDNIYTMVLDQSLNINFNENISPSDIVLGDGFEDMNILYTGMGSNEYELEIVVNGTVDTNYEIATFTVLPSGHTGNMNIMGVVDIEVEQTIVSNEPVYPSNLYYSSSNPQWNEEIGEEYSFRICLGEQQINPDISSLIEGISLEEDLYNANLDIISVKDISTESENLLEIKLFGNIIKDDYSMGLGEIIVYNYILQGDSNILVSFPIYDQPYSILNVVFANSDFEVVEGAEIRVVDNESESEIIIGYTDNQGEFKAQIPPDNTIEYRIYYNGELHESFNPDNWNMEETLIPGMTYTYSNMN